MASVLVVIERFFEASGKNVSAFGNLFVDTFARHRFKIEHSQNGRNRS